MRWWDRRARRLGAWLLAMMLPARAVAGPECRPPVDQARRAPLPLRGKLVVTYIEDSIDEDQGDVHELGLFDLDHPDRGLHRITHDLANQSEVEISPDGSRFLYTERKELDAFGEVSELWMRDLDGGHPVRLLGGSRMGVPAWVHPGGEELLFISWGRERDARLFRYDVAAGRVRPHPVSLEGAADPEVSDDGRWVTFKMAVEGDRDHQPSIYVMAADGSQVRRLTEGYSDHDPVFSRDGRKIYFERYYGPGDWFEASQDRGEPEHNLWSIVEVDRVTRRERVLVPHDPCGRHFYWLPTVAPDGEAVMFIHIDVRGEEEGKPWTDLWVTDPDGGRLQKVPGSDWFYFFDWTR